MHTYAMLTEQDDLERHILSVLERNGSITFVNGQATAYSAPT